MGLRNGQFSSVELVEACLQRIDTYNQDFHSFITVHAEKALQSAQAADDLYASEVTDKPLLGIPIAVKDLYEVAGFPTTAGSPLLQDALSNTDSFVAQRIKTCGGIILGKTNLNEWAMGATGENDNFGTVRNPWDRQSIAGGSSSGSAAALAAGFCPLAIGSDTGGSIRVPAALCGVVGMKPSYGRISLNGVIPLSWTLDHAGSMARTVRDVAILVNVLAGPDPRDERTWGMPIDNYIDTLEDGIDGIRIAYPEMSAFTACSSDVCSMMSLAVQTVEALGANTKETSLAWILDARTKNRTIIAVESNVLHHDQLMHNPDRYSPPALERLRKGQAVSSIEYGQALLARGEFRRAFRSLFDKVDILITPTTPIPAPKLDDENEMAYAREHLSTFLGAFNLTGLPAISIPWTMASNGLPIGLQIIGGEGRDSLVLRTAHAIEQSHGLLGIAPL
jgi:aspartyl-tRNA(Asn)/glutamyl-tRNA(Gln) amidotransferase subunit A